MIMKQFEIKAYTKKELALYYFPTAENTHSAVQRLMSWINHCDALRTDLEAHGYLKMSKWFSPREVKSIVEHLGEP